ncbi:MAG: tRNA (guanine-N(1)-)-methyltransferase [Parcubacteria group bacterium GW2011_GWF1_43_9]|nr:MAG: tRNA (guanine-N(1)-)-methyltransferase [Parcubacteria group bacterium GW2011_GWF1_43_9]
MKHFDIISIFPNSLDSYFGTSILKRAQDKKLIKIQSHDLRKWTRDKHHKTDDKLYGGGAGMVMLAEPILRALSTFKALNKESRIKNKGKDARGLKFQIRNSKFKIRTILLAANGKQFKQKDAERLVKYDRLVFVCGRYEGVDARVEKFIDEKISVGPYVVTGGELPAAIIIDAVSRLIPGVVGKQESVANESHTAEGYLEHNHYTRPEVLVWKGKKYRVPKVLLEGHHKNIASWRAKTSKKPRA